MLRCALIGAMSLAVGAADETQEVANKRDLQAMQGPWKLVAQSREGKEVPPEKFGPPGMKIEGDAMFILDKDGETLQEIGLKIVSTGKSKAIDMLHTVQGNEATVEGLYLLEKETLRFCVSRPGGTRPQNLKSEKDNMLLVFERTKPDDAEDETATAPVKLEIRLAKSEPEEGFDEAQMPQTEQKIYVHKEAVLVNADIESARVIKNELGRPVIEVVFVEASREKVAAFSGDNIGNIAAIFLDGKLITAPVIRAKLSDKAVIEGKFSMKEAKRIAAGLHPKE